MYSQEFGLTLKLCNHNQTNYLRIEESCVQQLDKRYLNIKDAKEWTSVP